MVDRLPDELVLAIVEELAASRVGGDGTAPIENRDVRRALAIMCLVSRRLRIIAQPVLWRRVNLANSVQLGRVRNGTAASLGRFTRYYAAQAAYDRAHDYGQVLGVADVLPRIAELLVNGIPGPTLNPGLFLPHEHLRRLALVGVDLGQQPAPSLPRLEQLSMRSVKQALETTRSWICSSSMPALRVLRVVGMSAGPGRVYLHQLVDDAVLAQLDVVRTTSKDLHHNHAWVPMVDLARIAVPPVLVEDAKPRTCVLSRYTIFSLSPADDARAMVQRLVIIAHGPSVATSHPVLVVPKLLLERVADLPDVAADLQGVEALLATKGAHILWYESDYPHDFVPPSVLRYARELKAQRAREEEEGGRSGGSERGDEATSRSSS